MQGNEHLSRCLVVQAWSELGHCLCTHWVPSAVTPNTRHSSLAFSTPPLPLHGKIENRGHEVRISLK